MLFRLMKLSVPTVVAGADGWYTPLLLWPQVRTGGTRPYYCGRRCGRVLTHVRLCVAGADGWFGGLGSSDPATDGYILPIGAKTQPWTVTCPPPPANVSPLHPNMSHRLHLLHLLPTLSILWGSFSSQVCYYTNIVKYLFKLILCGMMLRRPLWGLRASTCKGWVLIPLKEHACSTLRRTRVRPWIAAKASQRFLQGVCTCGGTEGVFTWVGTCGYVLCVRVRFQTLPVVDTSVYAVCVCARARARSATVRLMQRLEVYRATAVYGT